MTISVNCKACGKVYSVKIEAAGSTFVCQECGNACVVPGATQAGVVPVPVGNQPSKALAIVSLVLSIIAVPAMCMAWIPWLGWFCIYPVSGCLALAGAITGFIGLKKVKAGTASGKGLAMGGMIIGIVFISINIILVVLVLVGAIAGGAVYFVEYNNF